MAHIFDPFQNDGELSLSIVILKLYILTFRFDKSAANSAHTICVRYIKDVPNLCLSQLCDYLGAATSGFCKIPLPNLASLRGLQNAIVLFCVQVGRWRDDEIHRILLLAISETGVVRLKYSQTQTGDRSRLKLNFLYCGVTGCRNIASV